MNHEMIGIMQPHQGGYWVFILFRRVLGSILPLLLLYFIYKLIKEKDKDVVKKLETPLERLKMRLAKGEITKEEYKDLKEIIKDE